MKRNLDLLTNETFDLIIVGAGIYGAATALDAVQRGLSVAIVDQGDFGSGTSANSLKIVHGGLRYLQQLDIKRFRESVRERRIMMHLAPHLIHPLPCVMPTCGFMMKGPLVMTAGLLVNDVLSADRNRLGDPEKTIPAGKVVSAKECLRLVPGIDPKGVNGGACWTDAQMYSSERLVLAFVKSAVAGGARAANYVRASGVIRKEDRVVGVRAEDRIAGDRFEIRGHMVINTAGAWVDDINGFSGSDTPQIQLSTAMNLIVNRRLLPETAAGIYAPFTNVLTNGSRYRGRHVLFMTPWRDKTIIGTYHLPYNGHPNDMKVMESEVQDFLSEINAGYPGEPVQRKEVTGYYKGFLPMEGLNPKTGEVVLKKHYGFTDYEKKYGVKGLLSVIGVKYTTARDVARKTVDLAGSKLGRKLAKSISHRVPLAGGDIVLFDEFLNGALRTKPADLPERVIQRLVMLYGTEYPGILDLAGEIRGKDKTVSGSAELLKAEIIHAVRNEMAVTLSDIVHRRTDAGSAGHPGDDLLSECAKIAARELNWSKSQVSKELADAASVYRTW
ncbi:glycerol-3-phosphate dehydrogenase/oxidase [bacterium]|nr:glycerol-3-phosphate dehydrogenase/oxidase [bacterium]